ncbi:MAG: NAD-dependent epimerase/dehydratase family protein [Bacteroidota bacterium]
MEDRGNILITGATGFIGGHVVRLFAEKRVNMSCLVRDKSNREFINHLPIRFEAGDITDYPGLLKVFRGKDSVIHIAALTTDWGRRDAFHRINVDGTMNVMKAAKESGIMDVIITGSISSYGEEDSSMIKDEDAPDRSHYPYFLDTIFPSGMNYYRDSKCMATQEAIRFASDNKMNLTVLEPVWVYGENEFSSGFYEYMKAVSSGMMLMPGSKKNNFHVVYAGDLADAYYEAYEHKLKGVNRIIIGNERTDKMHVVHGLFCQEAGMDQPRNAPRLLLYPIALCMELLATLFKFKKAPMLTRARVNMFYDNIGYDTSKAWKLLDYKPVTALEDGIRRTVRWYKKYKYL